MGESLTFTWNEGPGEARPSPTTRRRLAEWHRTVNEEEIEDYTAVEIYYLDFLQDVIGELTHEYNTILEESFKTSALRKKMSNNLTPTLNKE